jgi:hypothetical protein
MSDTRETLRRGIGGFAPRPDGYERVLQRRDRRRRNQRIMAGALAVAIGLAGILAFVAALRSQQTPADSDISHNGDWIAYSTTSGDAQRPRGDDYPTGSDIFLVREGREPRLVASRGDGRTWNVCPAFSPDGTMLAFGTKSPSGRAVRVVGVTRTGEIVAPSIDLEVPGRGLAPCPRWASDGSRLAYVNGGTVIIRGLDGSLPAAAPGDPVLGDFRASANPLVSPGGDLVAQASSLTRPCGVIVARPDGSDERVLDTGCVYAVAAWSPDGRKILVMLDVSGLHFNMLAWSVDAPFESVLIAERVRVNHARSWPGLGDVSWQPSTP